MAEELEEKTDVNIGPFARARAWANRVITRLSKLGVRRDVDDNKIFYVGIGADDQTRHSSGTSRLRKLDATIAAVIKDPNGATNAEPELFDAITRGDKDWLNRPESELKERLLKVLRKEKRKAEKAKRRV
jgi:hypothetical protein